MNEHRLSWERNKMGEVEEYKENRESREKLRKR